MDVITLKLISPAFRVKHTLTALLGSIIYISTFFYLIIKILIFQNLT